MAPTWAGARSSDAQLYRRGFTTELSQNDVVFGGEKKLRQAILELAARYRGEAKAAFQVLVNALVEQQNAGDIRRDDRLVCLRWRAHFRRPRTSR